MITCSEITSEGVRFGKCWLLSVLSFKFYLYFAFQSTAFRSKVSRRVIQWGHTLTSPSEGPNTRVFFTIDYVLGIGLAIYSIAVYLCFFSSTISWALVYIGLVIGHTMRHRAIYAIKQIIGAHSCRGHQEHGGYSKVLHRSERKLNYLAINGVLGHFQSVHGINVKGIMVAHLEEVTKDLDHEVVLTKLMNQFREGHLHEFCETVQDEFNLDYVQTYYHVWLTISSLGEFYPLANRTTIYHAIGLLVSILPKKTCVGLIKRFAEIGAVIGLEGLINVFDHCEVNSKGVFTSKSDIIPLFESRGTLYDTRSTNMFGDGGAVCPGRMYVRKFYLSQKRYKDQLAKLNKAEGKQNLCPLSCFSMKNTMRTSSNATAA